METTAKIKFAKLLEKASSKEEIKKIKKIEEARELPKRIEIVTKWSKSRMWGENPKTEIKAIFDDEIEYYQSGRVSGCGYDKLSTAVAKALNKCEPILKKMYAIKEKNINKANREIFGYGSGYGLLPHFEGGVGITSTISILENLGYQVTYEFSNNNTDIFVLELKN